MSPQLFAILTIVIIGGIAFLLGWLLTSTKWKKKYYEQERLRKVLEHKTTKQEGLLKKARIREREMEEKLTVEKSAEKERKLIVGKLQKINTDLRTKIATSTNGTSVTYNRLMNELDEEKKKTTELQKNLENLNAESEKNTVILPHKVLLKDSNSNDLVQATQDQRLLPILERVAIFSNPIQKDNLSAINGISEVLAINLNMAGFVNYKQIAMLTEKDLCIISEVMGMKSNQAMEDGWLTQARNLYHKKYR